MRFVLLALLAANIVFFAWARWIDVPAPSPVTSARDASLPPLQLEPAALAGAPSAASAGTSSPSSMPPAPAAAAPLAPAASAAANSSGGASGPATGSAQPAPGALPPAAAATNTGTAAAAAGRCRTLGPFDDVNLANTVADRLRTRGFSPRDRSAETANPNVYWVYIGELTSEAQRRAIQTLNAAGIHDAASMTQPEQSDRVSVGVFADQAHAVRRAEQVRSLGFKPTLGVRQRTVTAHWVDFELKGGEPEPAAADLIGPSNRAGIGLAPPKMADCPGSTGGG